MTITVTHEQFVKGAHVQGKYSEASDTLVEARVVAKGEPYPADEDGYYWDNLAGNGLLTSRAMRQGGGDLVLTFDARGSLL
jgi:hypothetical protein